MGHIFIEFKIILPYLAIDYLFVHVVIDTEKLEGPIVMITAVTLGNGIFHYRNRTHYDPVGWRRKVENGCQRPKALKKCMRQNPTPDDVLQIYDIAYIQKQITPGNLG